MNYWYSCRPHEIFLDLDSNRAVARALSVLRLALIQGKLAIDSVWLYPTGTAHHAHMIVVLKQSISFESRIAWSLWMGNDRLRAAYVLKRHAFVFIHEDLFVSRHQYYRPFDATCVCKTLKHKEKKVTDRCAAMDRLLKSHASADYFARTGEAPPKRKIRVPWGKVPLTVLRHWRAEYERKRKQ